MSSIQKIKIRRTNRTLESFNSDVDTNIDFGEIVYVNETTNAALGISPQYLLLGPTDGTNMANANVKALKLQDRSIVDNSVFYTLPDDGGTWAVGDSGKVKLTNDSGNSLMPATLARNVSYGNTDVESNLDIINQYLDPSGATPVPVSTISLKANTLKTVAATDGKYYVLGVVSTTNDDPNSRNSDSTSKTVYHATGLGDGHENANGIYFNNTGVLFGSAWNDFAEYRECDCNEPGTCVVEVGDGTLMTSNDYLLPAASIISDTYGMVIGANKESSSPLAVAGRVLAKVENREELKVGDALKTAPHGKLAKMTREEIKEYPDRIVGYVSEFPTYEEWNGVKTNGRIWIKIK